MMNNEEPIHIAYCTDANYLEYVAISITSIILNNLNEEIYFHVFLYDVSQDEMKKLKNINKKINIYIINETELNKYSIDFKINHLNKSTYIRLLAPRLLANITEKFIYLDADILCFANISSIREINIDDVVCAASADSLPGKKDSSPKRLGMKKNYYFNAGFLYININNWIKKNIEKKTNDILYNSHNSFKYYDQDALNIILQGQVKPIDNTWNFLFTWMSEKEKEHYFFNKDTLPNFIHFTGGRKPWYIEHDGLSQQLYIFYKHFTPWAQEPLKSYKNKMRSTDYRVYAKSYFKKKKFLSAANHYVKYLISKTKSH